MNYPKLNLHYGLHTIELYLGKLKYAEVQRVIDRLMDIGQIYLSQADPYNIDRSGESGYFVREGIRLRIYQSYNKSNGIAFIVNPGTLLSGEYQPVNLWIPSKAAVNKLLVHISACMDKLGLDQDHVRNLSLSQMDITENHWHDVSHDIPRDIRIFKKGYCPRNFEAVKNQSSGIKKRLFIIKSRKITIKAYDKIYELQQNGRCPESLKNQSILRWEVSMKREAFLKKLNLDRKDSLYKMLRTGYEQGQDILHDYFEKILPFSGDIVSYAEAKRRIQNGVSDKLLKEQMLFLLKKTSDSAGLSTAVHKLKKCYKNVDDRRVKRITQEFDKLGTAPITQPNG